MTNAVRTCKSNTQEVVQSFLPFDSCRDSFFCVIYITLFYESLIFVLSASRVSNSGIPLSAGMDNKSHKYCDGNLIRKTLPWNVLFLSLSSILFQLGLVICSLQKVSLGCCEFLCIAFEKNIEVCVSSWVALDYSVWPITKITGIYTRVSESPKRWHSH